MPFAIAAVLSAPFIFVLIARPVERRLALRYPLRRPVEAILVILGCLLGTAIITGSLVVGDTLDRSIRASAYDQLGPIDELVSLTGLDQAGQLQSELGSFSHPDVDGTLFFATAPAAVASTGEGALGHPRAQIVEVDFAAGQAFGGDPATTGLQGENPAPGAAAITSDLAASIDVQPGDTIQVFAYGSATTLTVDRILDRRGVAGFWRIDPRQQSYNVIVGPGFLEELTSDAAAAPGIGPLSEPPTVHIAISNVGGVEDGAARTMVVSAAVDDELDQVTARVQPVKQDLLDEADATGDALTQLYFTMGMFAVAAGILLLVNIFVMLADERRSELGMLRALGLRRSRLVAAFATEGWLYSLVAAAIGAFLGIQVGRLIAWRADRILTSGDELFSLNLTFSYNLETVLAGFVIGFAISILTIVITSVRVSRLNVIAAIRDLPTTTYRRARRRWAIVGIFLSVLGLLVTALGASSSSAAGVIVGPVLILVGVGPILARRFPVRPVTAAISALVIVWGAVFIPVLGALDIDIEIAVFLLQGLIMAGAAVTLLTSYHGVVGRWLAHFSSDSLSVRLGLAYPIARRFRTGMTLAMIAVVVLTLVYLSVISFMFGNQADEITADLEGGFGIVVTSNPTDPIAADDLAELEGVGDVAPLAYGFADFVVDDADPRAWPMTGFGPELVEAPPALQDPGDFDSEQAAWQAVLDDPNLIITDEFFLSTGGGPPSGTPNPGDEVTIIDPVSGRSRTVTIAALAENDFLFNGPFWGIEGYSELFGARAVANRFFAQADDEADAVLAIRQAFLTNGADADTVRSSIDTQLAQQSGFFTLMQQFVAAGLIVGIAGIGVIMIRAVRERRREVGVLRSLGFQPGAVGRAFLFEASFVAIEGVVIGILVALIGSYGLTASGNNFADGMDWGVPWLEVLFIAAVAVGASMLAALWPARRAADIEPAAALRIAD